MTTPNRTKTLIVGGTITHVNGEEWNHAYCAIEPADAITLDDIEWEYAGAAPAGAAPTETFMTYGVNGSAGDRYEVREYTDGRWTCTCPAFQYGKGKWCKHIHKVNY